MTSAAVLLFLLASLVGLGISIGPVYLSHIVLAGLAVATGATVCRRAGVLRIPQLPSNLHYFPLMMVGWYTVTLLWCPNQEAGIKYVFYLSYGSCITLAVVYYGREVKRMEGLVSAIMVVISVEIFLGMLEAFTEFRYPISPQSPLAPYFGRQMLLEPWAMPWRTLKTVTSYPTGFRWNPNNLATTLNIFLPFFLFHRKFWVKAAGAGAILLLVVMTSSRINLAAWLIMFVIYLVFFARLRGLYTALVFLGAVALCLTAPLAKEKMDRRLPLTLEEALHGWEAFKRFFSDEGYVGDSVGLRRLYVKNGLSAIAKSNGLGVGAGGAGEEELQPEAVAPGGTRASLHNYWLEMAVEAGLPFTFLFWAWYFYLVRLLFKRHRDVVRWPQGYFQQASALSLIGLPLAAVGTSSMVYEPALWLCYGMAIASINLRLEKSAGASR